jgi:hypothetical protein
LEPKELADLDIATPVAFSGPKKLSLLLAKRWSEGHLTGEQVLLSLQDYIRYVTRTFG